jgi:hypothetical protein
MNELLNINDFVVTSHGKVGQIKSVMTKKECYVVELGGSNIPISMTQCVKADEIQIKVFVSKSILSMYCSNNEAKIIVPAFNRNKLYFKLFPKQ